MADRVEPNSETEQTEKANLNVSQLSRDEVARRAYEISLRDDAGSDEDNWHRAERELQEQRRPEAEPEIANTNSPGSRAHSTR
jgi:hypothetical protein